MARTKNTRQIMEVMQAYLDGKKIECASVNHNRSDNGWRKVATPSWNWEQYDYRVKQEPREFTVLVSSEGKPLGIGTTDGVFSVKPVGLLGANVIKVREVL